MFSSDFELKKHILDILCAPEVIKNNAWVTLNNDFWVTSEAICQSFWKSLANRFTSDQESLFPVTNVLIYFLYALYVLGHTPPLKQLSITDFAIVAKQGLFGLSIVTSSQLICDVTRTLDTGIVTPNSSIVPARAYWRKGDLH